MNQTDKEQLRRKILKNRQSLSKSQWQAKSNSICENLQNSSLYRQAKTILAYFSFRQEANLNPLWQDNKTWGFPRCVNDNLQWHFWQQGEPLENNKYGISEPLATSPIISPQQVDLILIPTVACDYQKYRLGYGGGFYDRMLSNSPWRNIPTIGIVFDFAYLAQLPVAAWDKQLDYICTETILK